MRLSDLKTGESGVVIKILGHGSFRKRVMEMGFVKGRTVSCVQYAPLMDPIKYRIMDYEVSLRRSEAHLVEIVRLDPDTAASGTMHSSGTVSEPGTHAMHPAHDRASRVINIALVGNPNCGKTSLFNYLSGAREHVGNYSGVTVDATAGHFDYKGYRFNAVDLPGTYSLASYSPEELYVRRYLRDNTPDVIVNVIDASNLERNLYLTTELIDMDRSMVIALNMYDELERDGINLDYRLLGDMLGVPMVPTAAKTGKGVDNLLDCIISVYEGRHGQVRHIHVNLGPELEDAVRSLRQAMGHDNVPGYHFSPRYVAIKLLEGDAETQRAVEALPDHRKVLQLRDSLRERVNHRLDDDVAAVIAAEKYGFIAGALAETYTPGETQRNVRTRLIDEVVTSKILGFPLFFGIMFVIFWLTFAVGQYPMDWMQSGIDRLAGAVGNAMPDGMLKDLVADGIIGGVGGVIVFLPNILILYCCLSLLEDTGYMARAAFIMDKVMHRIGLHGKSFIPLVMGFGCNVPAMMATRTIESRSSRLITILINPFMSCSARVPLYVLLTGTFFPGHAALVFMAMYLLGIVMAVVTAKMLRRFKYKKDETPFVMELPPYRVPAPKAVLSHAWTKGYQYLRKMGGIILVASIAVWALNYFPRGYTDADATAAQAPAGQGTAGHDSYLEMAGKAINPVMEPLGFNWRSSVAALAGIPAKEIVVSTLGVLYTNDEAVDDATLGQRLEQAPAPGADPGFTPLTALSFMIFILLYCPCMATVAAIVRETGDWRYGAFSVVYNTAVAWLAAFVAYQGGLLLGFT